MADFEEKSDVDKSIEVAKAYSEMFSEERTAVLSEREVMRRKKLFFDLYAREIAIVRSTPNLNEHGKRQKMLDDYKSITRHALPDNNLSGQGRVLDKKSVEDMTNKNTGRSDNIDDLGISQQAYLTTALSGSKKFLGFTNGKQFKGESTGSVDTVNNDRARDNVKKIDRFIMRNAANKDSGKRAAFVMNILDKKYYYRKFLYYALQTDMKAISINVIKNAKDDSNALSYEEVHKKLVGRLGKFKWDYLQVKSAATQAHEKTIGRIYTDEAENKLQASINAGAQPLNADQIPNGFEEVPYHPGDKGGETDNYYLSNYLEAMESFVRNPVSPGRYKYMEECFLRFIAKTYGSENDPEARRHIENFKEIAAWRRNPAINEQYDNFSDMMKQFNIASTGVTFWDVWNFTDTVIKPIMGIFGKINGIVKESTNISFDPKKFTGMELKVLRSLKIIDANNVPTNTIPSDIAKDMGYGGFGVAAFSVIVGIKGFAENITGLYKLYNSETISLGRKVSNGFDKVTGIVGYLSSVVGTASSGIATFGSKALAGGSFVTKWAPGVGLAVDGAKFLNNTKNVIRTGVKKSEFNEFYSDKGRKNTDAFNNMISGAQGAMKKQLIGNGNGDFSTNANGNVSHDPNNRSETAKLVDAMEALKGEGVMDRAGNQIERDVPGGNTQADEDRILDKKIKLAVQYRATKNRLKDVKLAKRAETATNAGGLQRRRLLEQKQTEAGWGILSSALSAAGNGLILSSSPASILGAGLQLTGLLLDAGVKFIYTANKVRRTRNKVIDMYIGLDSGDAKNLPDSQKDLIRHEMGGRENAFDLETFYKQILRNIAYILNGTVAKYYVEGMNRKYIITRENRQQLERYFKSLSINIPWHSNKYDTPGADAFMSALTSV